MQRLKDGYQSCPRCQGVGCYRCHRRGYLVQCPVCMNSELELIAKGDVDYRCLGCRTVFSSSGKIVSTE